MLVEKEISYEDKVVAVKLISGEELLARCVQDDHSKKTKVVRVKQPLCLSVGNPRVNEQGMTRVMFTPWMLSLGPDAMITIKSEHILSLAEASDNARQQYENAVLART
jgi:hypothetical protein